jgi:hypothetical protein
MVLRFDSDMIRFPSFVGPQWLMSIILAIQEAEIRKMAAASPGK